MELFTFSSPYWWLSLGLAFILLELLIPGIYLFWIGLAVLFVALPAGFMDLSATYLVFFFVFFLALSVWIGMKVQARKNTQADHLNQGLASYVGTLTTVAQIDAQGQSPIRIHLAGTTYAAYCEQAVQVGDTVKVTAVDDGKLFIQKAANAS